MTASATNTPAIVIPTRVLATELSLEWDDGVVDGEAVEFLAEEAVGGGKLLCAGGGEVFVWVGVAGGGGAAVVEGAGVEVDGADRGEPGGVVCSGVEGDDGVEIAIGGGGGAVTTTGASGNGGENLESDAGVGGGDDAGRGGGGGGEAES
ncbi:hypothetical protein B296_00046153 [Ensete ventricosum]|uniref:Uncharacterized protein n=1 Tax=Ensete ventricosum TaxID=4639 RepID=A0A426YN26_ENSVE|nr:hypothetical protein B296_00046153 [Ensete ventricosum]